MEGVPNENRIKGLNQIAMRIGILTFEFNYNYGGLLQAYALSRTLENIEKGNEIQVVRRGWREYIGASKPIRNLSDVPGYLMGKLITLKAFNSFRKKYMHFTETIKDDQHLKEVASQFDCVVVGSDQIWNDEIFEPMGCYYFAEAFPANVRKIAYAVSFGKDQFVVPSELKPTLLSLLGQFSALSVREKSGKDILQGLGFDSTFVLDPTLLLNADAYPCAKRKHKDRYLCRYFLDETPAKRAFSTHIAEQNRLQEVNNYLNLDFKIPVLRKIVNNRYIPVPEWLSNIKHADLVITDSFHGMVFSIIFQKQFLVFKNQKRGNARFESLLSELGLLNRLVDENDTTSVRNLKAIDYAGVSEKLELLKASSLRFLSDSLQ